MVETINRLIRTSRQLPGAGARAASGGSGGADGYAGGARQREIMKISQDPVSLETPIGEEEDSHLGDFIQDDHVQVPLDAVVYSAA